jgi:hypothetical protein
MYQNLSDKEFLQLIFASEGRLGLDYVEEAKVRRLVVIPFLCDVLTNSGNFIRNFFAHHSSDPEEITVS